MENRNAATIVGMLPAAAFVHDSAIGNAAHASGAPWWEKPADAAAVTPGRVERSVTHDGYRGIWFRLGHDFEYGDKYSGGLGTYTANHEPMAQYVPAAHKTFFTYGGAPAADQRRLVIYVSYYDHATGLVPRPVALFADPSVDDPHDNASLHVDAAGHVWIFKSGRGNRRPGLIFRSTKPHDIGEFELLPPQTFTYPQIWTGDRGEGMFLLFTKYFPGTRHGPARNLFWKTSVDGRTWSEDRTLAEFGGHYQTSGRWRSADGALTKFATFFNHHPESNVDRRTNLYYAQTVDGGATWTRADGAPLALPLTAPDNAALVLDLQSAGRFMYTCDLNFDAQGNPILLCIVSRAGEPGPAGDPREWTVLHWTGAEWARHVVVYSDHNYDMGSLYVDGDRWRIIGPTGKAPQKWGTGGEMEAWTSIDAGRTWTRERALTADSRYNHSYARRPLDAHPDFAAFWADGHPAQMTPSRLYFSNADGTRVYRLPYDMEGDKAVPEALAR